MAPILGSEYILNAWEGTRREQSRTALLQNCGWPSQLNSIFLGKNYSTQDKYKTMTATYHTALGPLGQAEYGRLSFDSNSVIRGNSDFKGKMEAVTGDKKSHLPTYQ